MLLVEVNSSGSSTTPKSGELQMIKSSTKRLRSTAVTVRAAIVSSTKSRLPTASIEFSRSPLKPKSSATLSRLIGKLVVASAPAPRGHRSAHLKAAFNRWRSRSSASDCDMR